MALCLGAARGWCADGPFPAQLPEFNLPDPAGAAHGRNDLLANGAVIVVTIPNVKHGAFSERWVRFLKKYLPSGGPRLVVVEDLSQSNVRVRAVQGLKDSYEPGQPTLVLNDGEGQFRRALRVPADETAVLVYDREGRLVHAVSGLEAPDDVIEAAKQAGKLVTRLWAGAPKATASPRAGGKSGDGLAEK